MKPEFIFSEVIARAKETLGCKKDKDLAALLGMTPQTFGNRKNTESIPFPEIIQASLIAGVDSQYILTGIRSAPMGVNHQNPGYTVTPALNPREAALLDNYRHVESEEDRRTIERVAMRTAEAVKMQTEFKEDWDGINRRKKAEQK
jgi:hypothetical protein